MERHGDCALEASIVRPFLGGEIAGRRLDQRSNQGGPHRLLVCKSATDLQRYAGLSKTLSVEQFPSSNVTVKD